jgi:hypothetical protein
MGEAQRFRAIFYHTYSRLRWWQLEQQREAEQNGKIRTVGQAYILPERRQLLYGRSQLSHPSRAPADLQMLAIQRIYAQLLERRLSAFLINFVHVLQMMRDSTLLKHEICIYALELRILRPGSSCAPGRTHSCGGTWTFNYDRLSPRCRAPGITP